MALILVEFVHRVAVDGRPVLRGLAGRERKGWYLDVDDVLDDLRSGGDQFLVIAGLATASVMVVRGPDGEVGLVARLPGGKQDYLALLPDAPEELLPRRPPRG